VIASTPALIATGPSRRSEAAHRATRQAAVNSACTATVSSLVSCVVSVIGALPVYRASKVTFAGSD